MSNHPASVSLAIALRRLLDCPDLGLDELEPETCEAIDGAEEALDAYEAAPEPRATQAPSLQCLDLLGRALVYVEQHPSGSELAHSIRNALQVAHLAEGETLSTAEEGEVRAVMLSALRTLTDWADANVTDPAAIIPINEARAAIACAEAAASSRGVPSVLRTFPELPTDYPRDNEAASAYAEAVSLWRHQACERFGLSANG